jgi:hypothetical protein
VLIQGNIHYSFSRVLTSSILLKSC